MGQRSGPSRRGLTRLRHSEWGGVFRLASRYADLAVVPWLLELPVLCAYLLARIASLGIPFALFILGRRAAPHLAELAIAPDQLRFQAAAARVNLGYLMVCGAVALFVMVSAPWAAKLLDLPLATFDEILVWLVIGQSAPVLFGATALLMHAVERGAFYDLLLGLTAVLFLVGVLLVPDARDGELIALTLAAAQLTQAALCALLLTQSGVWPGLTALFHKEIKLF